jgi:TPR repeat protein
VDAVGVVGNTPNQVASRGAASAHARAGGLGNAHLAASVGAVIVVLLSGEAIAGALEDCAAAYDRRNYPEALQLCRPLAEHGDARAQLSLGGMYYNGQGVQQDYPEAAKWTRKAAEQNYPPAQAELGVLYWNGQGVPQDAVLAYMWLSLAAAVEPDAAEERDAAASQMTADEIAEAQRLAREWKPTTPFQ